eukprot:9473632-Pyramimonas_sp.AAC.1
MAAVNRSGSTRTTALVGLIIAASMPIAPAARTRRGAVGPISPPTTSFVLPSTSPCTTVSGRGTSAAPAAIGGFIARHAAQSRAEWNVNVRVQSTTGIWNI